MRGSYSAAQGLGCAAPLPHLSAPYNPPTLGAVGRRGEGTGTRRPLPAPPSKTPTSQIHNPSRARGHLPSDALSTAAATCLGRTGKRAFRAAAESKQTLIILVASRGLAASVSRTRRPRIPGASRIARRPGRARLACVSAGAALQNNQDKKSTKMRCGTRFAPFRSAHNDYDCTSEVSATHRPGGRRPGCAGLLLAGVVRRGTFLLRRSARSFLVTPARPRPPPPRPPGALSGTESIKSGAAAAPRNNPPIHPSRLLITC